MKLNSEELSQESILPKLDSYIAAQVKRLHIPGAVLAVVTGDKIIHTRSFGYGHLDKAILSPHTPLFIGSLTKSFTALAILQLAEANKLDLDLPVQRYLPWFKIADPHASSKITIRHLLNQTSGLPEGAGERILADFDERPDANERQIRSLANLKLAHPVGSKVAYCNLNYNILGLIIEVVSGEWYSDYVQDHIFNPLEMTHSYTSKEKAKQNGLATGHRYWFGFPIPVPNLPIPNGSLASGQLISTAEDMAHYLISHINDGRFMGKQILSKSGIAETHRGIREYVKMGISSGKYGMGWFEIDIGSTKTYSHGGNVPDFSSFMVILPEQKTGLVLLFNADPYGLPPIIGEVGMGLTALFAGEKPAPIRLKFIQWVMPLLLLIPFLQALGVVKVLKRMKDWRKNSEIHPDLRQFWINNIIVPLIPDLTLFGTLTALISNKMFGFFRLFMPDISWILMICGGFSGIWAVIRTILMVKTWRKPK